MSIHEQELSCPATGLRVTDPGTRVEKLAPESEAPQHNYVEEDTTQGNRRAGLPTPVLNMHVQETSENFRRSLPPGLFQNSAFNFQIPNHIVTIQHDHNSITRLK
jgi:hypothetical protein